MLFSKPVPKSCCRKLLPKVHSKASPQNCGSSKLLLKIIVQSCSSKLLLFLKGINSTKMSPKGINSPQLQLFPKIIPKARPQSRCTKISMIQTHFSKQIPKIILQSGFPKLLRKVAPKADPKISF